MGAAWTPRTDIVEHEDVYMLRVDLPGFSQEAIDLSFQDGVLTLKGERPADQDSQHRYHRRERAHGAFVRHFTFGKHVDAEQIAASYQNGVLEIRLPKSGVAKTKKIAVQGS
jgi:HSP20 family protein